MTPHVKRLKAFERIELEPGASRRVGFRLDRDALKFADREGDMVFEPGRFTFRVGTLERTIELE